MKPKPPKHTFEEKLARRRRSRMTMAIGFKCEDGIVLCCDSLEADGFTKRFVDKTSVMGYIQPIWGVAMAGAGGGGILDKFFKDTVAQLLESESDYDIKLIEELIEEVLARYRKRFRIQPFRILVGVFNRSLNKSFLYRNDEKALAPIDNFAHVGVGASLWKFFVENLHDYYMTCEESAALAAFILREAKQHVDGVDGPTTLIIYKHGTVFWKHYIGAEIREIEKRIPTEEFADLLQRYWRSRQAFRRRNEAIPKEDKNSPG